MATNEYVNKVELADGRTLIDISSDTVAANKILSGYTAHDKSGAPITGTIQDMAGQSVTPTRQQQTISTNGKHMTGDIVIAAIPNTYYTQEEALELFYPVGSIYISTSSTAPSFGGTWEEVIVKQTWDQLKHGYRDYFAGENTGNLHYWKRIS